MGRLPAVRMTDLHICPLSPPPGLPVIGPCLPTVLVGKLPSARMTDGCACIAAPDPILRGSSSVFFGKLPSARMLDMATKGGGMSTGFPTVFIGEQPPPPWSPLGGSLIPAQYLTPAPTKFEQDFLDITGMTVQDSIDLYEAETGEALTPQTVETLFTDPAKAKELLTGNRNLHSAYRDILNRGVPATMAEAEALGYTQPRVMGSTYLGNWYHDPGNNTKWVSPNGHLEGVYDRAGALVNSNDFKGTFNFFGPDNTWGHKAADVDPFRSWGGN